MRLVIDQQVAQAVVNFLKRQPFEEVHQLMAAMLSLKPLEHVEAEQKKEAEPSKRSQAKTS